MDDRDILTAQFEANRPHLRAVAYRMLGSQSEAGVGVAVILGGQLRIVLHLTFTNGRIAGIDAVADPDQVRALDPAVLDG
jgi:RNA polymerase sigma-70 factor (ECF subfamily)